MENYATQDKELRQRISKEVKEAIARFDWAGLNMTVNKPQRGLLNVIVKIRDKRAQGRLCK